MRGYVSSNKILAYYDCAVELPTSGFNSLGIELPVFSVVTGFYVDVLLTLDPTDVDISYGWAGDVDSLFIDLASAAFIQGEQLIGRDFNINPLKSIGARDIGINVGSSDLDVGQFQVVLSYDKLDR